MNLKNYNIKKDWTLFLDRDGVINEQLLDNYVTKWSEFKFINDVLSSINKLSFVFGRIFVVTNQQGIGKGLMTVDDLNNVHNMMKDEIENAGGKIDKIYFCSKLENENSEMRKPNTGMALQAKIDFPEIDFEKSIMLGDSMSDMQFGRNLGMKTVLIPSKNKVNTDSELIDFLFKSMAEFVDAIILQ